MCMGRPDRTADRRTDSTTARPNPSGKRSCPAPDEAGAGAGGREAKVSHFFTCRPIPMPRPVFPLTRCVAERAHAFTQRVDYVL